VLKGVPNNLEFLAKLVEDPRFAAGDTTTKFLEDFHFSPRVMEVVLPGVWCCCCCNRVPNVYMLRCRSMGLDARFTMSCVVNPRPAAAAAAVLCVLSVLQLLGAMLCCYQLSRSKSIQLTLLAAASALPLPPHATLTRLLLPLMLLCCAASPAPCRPADLCAGLARSHAAVARWRARLRAHGQPARAPGKCAGGQPL
jgi:hypothetical protein